MKKTVFWKMEPIRFNSCNMSDFSVNVQAIQQIYGYRIANVYIDKDYMKKNVTVIFDAERYLSLLDEGIGFKVVYDYGSWPRVEIPLLLVYTKFGIFALQVDYDVQEQLSRILEERRKEREGF